MVLVASVRLKEGSEHYFACFKLPTGKVDAKGRAIFRRVQRSTGTVDETRALQMALSYERAAVLAGEKRFTEQAARNFLAEIRAVSAVSVAEVEPTDVFLRRWLKSRLPSLNGHTPERYRLAVDQFITYLGDRHGAPLGDISAIEAASFRDAEVAAGKGPTTVNKGLGILAMAFDEARIQHGLEKNPFRGINVRGAKKRRQRRRPFTFDQFSALVRATSGDWRTLIMVCGYTGARQQEATKLRWEQIELTTGRLTLERTKTVDTHWIPIHPSLAWHFRQIKPKASGFVIPEIAPKQRRAISNDFRRAILPLIGLAQPYAKRTEGKGKGRTLAAYSLHSLRHSLSTWLEAAGVEESMRMKLVGHEDENVNRGYTHTELAVAAAELAKVPSVAA